MSNVINIDETNGCAAATGRQIAIDTFVALDHDKRSRLASARMAADALLDDMTNSTRRENVAELTAFIDELLAFSGVPKEREA